ncbi:hypothetical protein HanXRQr2_Chr04g0174931 [Helianthus annuus]|uniref:Transmembrane protein n=1 Tax=Helianthus annuus TaxID=4232 RepID=A0A9K3J9F3_HELAN|nr:hypothetical protein HanXRQr2_Chr04g0174931 [Helianthus annuus]KAJ0581625.1 hypothetical protein HanHA300_Chr04g0143211 [Helianthus annuus]KAJ0589635.1 hypothetical protein HanIR_Chr04g0188491 [Helianthus annuus]KAJ0597592.1 hypothetical protein HanHA89_Chr04g0156401 [Helianthus annuus]KAJ0761897.1 hypothetical protein HanOQP8_Chr04g0155311 [Helianthus annuus]
MEVGSGDEGFVFCFLRGGFCVVCFCGGDGDLGNMARGGLLCFFDFLLVEVPRFFVFISHSLLSFCSLFQTFSFVSFAFCIVFFLVTSSSA